MYWAVIGAAIAFAAVANALEKVQRWQRSFRISLPPLGRIILVISNLIVVLVFCFYKLDTTDQWSFEDVGYRTGFIAICQLPLIFLLAGKENIIGALTGLGYERLNWLHRWVARTLWLTVTIHMGFWFRSWGRYHFIASKIKQDPITQRGLAAWAILTFIVLTSWLPIRRLNYEIFVITHLVTFSGVIGAVWIHVPEEVKVWVWIPIGLFFFDRLMRARRVIWANITLLHPLRRKNGTIQQGLWANKATLTPLPGNITRITIPQPAISWKPGQHVFLACHSVVPLQAHPFTIASLLSDGKMEFYIKAEKGGTKRFRDHASKIALLPSSESPQVSTTKHVSIEGPYGCPKPLDQFDSVVLFAGSTGATFTLPQMRDIVAKWRQGVKLPFSRGKTARPVTRRIRFVWVVKSRAQLSWFGEQLEQVARDTRTLRQETPELDIDVEISVYVTCDKELVAEKQKQPLLFSRQKQLPAPAARHGEAREISPAEKESGATAVSTSKEAKEITTDVRSTAGSDSDDAITEEEKEKAASGCCQPDGGCCCRTTVLEGDDSDDPVVCMCGASSSPSSSAASTAASTEKPTPTTTAPLQSTPSSSLSSSITLRSGRPHPEHIIRKILEEAQGETAVVVCGPRGLRDDVRATTVRLCDERAVCKGTGAFGVWFVGEGFEY
ncbi:MAG: hypothetical protein Q9160_001103 [Pyrenula sp. 1 TL-2023]